MILILMLLASFISQAQSTSDLDKIQAAVVSFAQAADQQDAARLDLLLHPQYRAVVHRVFGGKELSLMDKATYLQLIRDKKIGGDTRKVTLLQTDVVNNIAQVRAVFEGKELRFTTYVSLVKLESGEWQVVGDMPDIVKM